MYLCPGSFLRVLAFLLLVGSPFAGPTFAQPLAIESEFLRGTFGNGIGLSGLSVANFDNGDFGTDADELVAAAGPGQFFQNDRWYILDQNAGGLVQVWRSDVYPDPIDVLRVADLDGDGFSEVLVASDGWLEIYGGWPLSLLRTHNLSGFGTEEMRVGDLEGDGSLEVVYCDDFSNLLAIDWDTGATEQSWAYYCASLDLGDTDDDPALEIVLAGNPGRVIDGATGALEFEDSALGFGRLVRVGEIDGTPPEEIVSGSWGDFHRWDYSSPGDYAVVQIIFYDFNDVDTFEIHDVDGDAVEEIVYGQDQWGDVLIYEGDGTLASTIDHPSHGVTGLAFGHFDGDADLDLALGSGFSHTGPDYLFVYDLTDALFTWQSHDATGPFYARAHGDVDADGSPELVYGSLTTASGAEPGLYFVRDAAHYAEEFVSPPIGIGSQGVRSLALADIDADPQLEIFVATNAGSSGTIPRVKVLDGLTHAEQFEIVGVEHRRYERLVVRDVDADGALELVTATGWVNNGAPFVGLHVYDAATGALEWEVDLDSIGDGFPLLEVGELDGTPGLEIVISHDENRNFGPDLRVFDGITQAEELSLELGITSLAIGDGGGAAEELYFGSSSYVLRYDWADTTLNVEHEASNPIDGLVVRDIDLDGFVDFVFVGAGELRVVSGFDGVVLFSRAVPAASGDRDSLLVDDIDGDGLLEIWVNLDTHGYEIFEIPPVTPGDQVPSVTITDPASSTSIYSSEDLYLAGTASDLEDGDLAASIEWRSSLDGFLGFGPSLLVPLSVGDHLVTAEVTDTALHTVQDAVSVTVLDSAPTVTISEPADGVRVGQNVSIDFTATATDPQEGDLSESIVWESDLVGTVGYGASFSRWDLAPGVHVITATAWDFDNQSGQDSVTIEIVDPATCTPGPGAALEENWESGVGSWTSSGLWHLASDTACLSPGYTSAVSSFYFGQESTCNFSTGSTASGELISPPISIEAGAELNFSSYRQVENGGSYDRTEVSIRPVGGAWSSLWLRTSGNPSSTAWSTEGPISLDTWSGQDVELRFRFDSLDSIGNTYLGWLVDDIQVTGGGEGCPPANTVPLVFIDSPSYGQTLSPTVLLEGHVIDPEETDPTAGLTWSSNVDGALGQGGSVPVTLSLGQHILSARYTDSSGAEGFADVVVTVENNESPSIQLFEPSPGTTVNAGTPVFFSASASDPEDGDLTAFLEWSSDLDGPIGSGGSFSTSLSGGSHTITVSVSDFGGASESTTTMVTVNANEAPTVDLVSPQAGPTGEEQETLSLGAYANDAEDGDLSSSIQWTSDLDGALGTGFELFVTLSPGTHTITASVTDSAGTPGSASVVVSVEANTSPVVDIVAPLSGEVFQVDEPISFGAYASDVVDGDLTYAIEWSSDVDGVFGSGGEATFTPTVGFHTITAAATDSFGETGTATITLQVNDAPFVTIDAPTNGSAFVQGDLVAFAATATDYEDGDLSSGLAWSSDLDGSIGTGASFNVDSTTLSVGTHAITATATDSFAVTGSHTITLTVAANTPPTVAIGQPADGTVVLVYDAVQFVGTASDAEDGTLDASIEWTSSLSGAMFTGASSWFLPFPGIQTITASVTDSRGATGSASITLVVEEAPDVAITAPADGTTVVVGSAATFTGTATDSLDGDLSGSIAWSSDLDGALGTGASVGATLSIGTHTITASSADSRGYTGTATITLVVQPSVPTIAITVPADGATVSADGPIAFAGTASDAQDGDLTASIAWTSNLDGKIGYGGGFDRQLSAGTHTITATVTDSSAETATDTITLTVEPAPIVEILVDGGLADGAHVVPGNAVTLDGAALGTDSLDYSSSIAWTSDVDGALGTGASISATLSTGVHAITASVTDGLGRTGTASARVFVTVDAPPAVTLVAPADGAWCYGPPCTVSLAATAIDPEDDDLTTAGVWTSDLEGAIDADGDGMASLGLGVHALTYTVTDSGGNVVTRSVLFRALDANDVAPSVTLTAPADAATAKDGDPVALAATASDGDLGDVSAFVEWTLLPAGTSLGTGASLDLTAGVELPTGTHTLRARLVDGALTAEDTVTITIDANPEPVVAITSPADATTVVDGDTVTITGTATDEEDGDLAASLAWSSDLDGAIGTGASVVTASLSVGTHTITAEAIDSRGATGSASVTITVAANDPPSVAITTPADGTVALDTDTVTFTAAASDAQDGDLSATVTWTSSLDGAIGTGASVATTLSVGSHTITADVADAQGLADSVSITVTVHRAPSLAISAPAGSASVIETESVSFAASASDPDDGDLTASIAWTSSLDGAIGSGAGFSTTSLSVGSHTVTAAVTDSNGATASDTVTVTVAANDPPSVAITAPADGTVALDTNTVTLTAAASDPQDGDLSASVTWTSSLDGAIGSGASITPALSPGTHTITADVADAQGLADSVSITVTVHRAPSLAITAPTNGLAAVQGDSVSFAATASDPDDGDLTASITWTSSLDGAIGTGASFATTALSPGAHTITATVTDSNGASASDTVTLSVNDVPSLAITAPADGTVVVTGTAVTFTGTASDALDGDLSGAIAWSSDLDGALGTGASVAATPSIGTHTITAMVVDSGGQGASAAITLVVQPSVPTIAITTPADGATVSADGPIAFAGTASDAQDGDLTASIAWVSNVDGKLGYGGSGFDRRLSAGTHTITATVTDSSAETATDSITLTVEPAPAVTIASPVDGGHVVPGNSLSLDGSAIGTDSVDISSSITWTSSIDGSLGTGASISATLSSGVHTISPADWKNSGVKVWEAVTLGGKPWRLSSQ